MEIKVLVQSGNLLGECPVWDASTNELLWVDIEKKTLHMLQPETGFDTKFYFDHQISAIVPIEKNTENYLLALQNGLAIFNRNKKSLNYFSDCEKDITNNRFNDGKCDPAGRFWIGSMDLNATEGKGSLYCVDHDLSLTKKLSGLSISNGMAWTKNGKTMYFVDTATQQISKFDFETETGSISNKTTAIEFPEKMGQPDGICIDSEDMLWVASWGGACITRWKPEAGEFLLKVEVPAKNITSLCFGGKNLDTLFITSAQSGLTHEDLEEFSLSGSVFACKPSVGGLIPNLFNMNEQNINS